MNRRLFIRITTTIVAVVCILVTTGVLWAQGRGVGLQRAIEVQERNTARLMEKQGVVGTAVGIDDGDKPVILVLLEHGNVAGIPGQLDGIKVKKEVTGKIHALADPTARFPRPVPIGVSTGHYDITAGTIGCRVTDGDNVYALSNNHVYADENRASTDDPVIQPGRYDGGVNPDINPVDVIGTLADFEPIDFDGTNFIDAAIAVCSTTTLGTATPEGGYGIPSHVTVAPKRNLRVKKYGRTTGLTYAKISAVNATVNVGYSSGTATFVNQIYIRAVGFSAGGDSGSLIVTESGNNPVGLLFAGSSVSTIANPINVVLQRFGVTVDDSTSPPPNQSPTASFTYTTSDLTADFTDQSTDSDGSVVSWSWDFGDGYASTAQNPTHAYAAADTYTVTLTVTDDDGATGNTSQDVTVSSSTPPTNQSPTASFAYATSGLTANFTDQSTDSDGSVVSWSWNFGDGHTSTAQNPTHTYAAADTYTVTLTVTDDDGATDSASQAVTVSEPGALLPMEVASITFPTAGPHLKIIITVAESAGPALAGIQVYAGVDGTPLSLAVTDSVGQVTYMLKRGASTGHDVTVTDLVDTRNPEVYGYFGGDVTEHYTP